MKYTETLAFLKQAAEQTAPDEQPKQSPAEAAPGPASQTPWYEDLQNKANTAYNDFTNWVQQGNNGRNLGIAGTAGILAMMPGSRRSFLNRLLTGVGLGAATYAGMNLYDNYMNQTKA